LDFAHPVTRAVFGEVAYGLFPSLAAGRSQVTFRTPFLDNDLVALAYRAPEAERHSTRASLDAVRRGNPTLSRIPTDRGVLLNDWRPARWARRVFAEVTFKLDYLHKDGLPGWLMPIEPAFTAAAHVGLIGLHKYLPYRNWFRTAVVGHVREVVTDPRTLQSPWWNAAELPAMLEAHVAGRQNYVRELNAVLTLEAIERLLLKPQPIAAREVIATS
jgi:asparagine synthase (glutamine-hydrolysing)